MAVRVGGGTQIGGGSRHSLSSDCELAGLYRGIVARAAHDVPLYIVPV